MRCLTVWRRRVARVSDCVCRRVAVVLELLDTIRSRLVLTRNLGSRLIADGRKLDLGSTSLVAS